MDINWSKAPDWAVAHGLHETGFGIKEFWLGETQHQNLEHAKSFPYGGGDPSRGSFHNSRRESFSYVTPRPAPWTGEGLPPAGTVCEFAGGTNCPEDPFDKDLKEGDEVTIIAHFKDGESELAAFTFNPRNLSRGNTCVEQGMHGCFRPIRTLEQIAAEDREKAIAEMVYGGCGCDQSDGTTTAFVICGLLYDAGYRKQVSE